MRASTSGQFAQKRWGGGFAPAPNPTPSGFRIQNFRNSKPLTGERPHPKPEVRNGEVRVIEVAGGDTRV